MFRKGKERAPSGMMESVMGTVSKAFLPYSSDRFPITGVIIIAPNPMICITFEQILYLNIFQIFQQKMNSIKKKQEETKVNERDSNSCSCRVESCL
jgi:hypothetical protein